MGCHNTKEKLEDEMMRAKLERIQVQFERQKQLQLLKDIDGIEHKAPVIPDYILPQLKETPSTVKRKKSSQSNNKLRRSNSKHLTPKRKKSSSVKKVNLINRINTNADLKGKKIIKKSKY